MAQQWSFVAAGAVVNGQNPTVPVPTGIQPSDLLVLVGATTNGSNNTPAGWMLASATPSSTPMIGVYYKLAGASESSVAVNNGSNTTGRAVMLAYRVNGSFRLDAAVASGSWVRNSSGSITTPAITATQVDDLVLSIYATTSVASTLTPDAATTSRVNSSSTSSLAGLLVADEDKASAGATTGRTMTYTNGPFARAGVLAFAQVQGVALSDDLYF